MVGPATAEGTLAEPMIPRPFRVRRVTRELADTFTLTLEPAEGDALAFAPGQFNMLYAFGVGEVAISISGDATQEGPLLHTIRGVGAVSRALCAVRPGEALGVRGPYGAGWPVTAAEGSDVIVIAGGVGLAPLRPAIYHLIAHRERYGRVVVLCGARTPRDVLFARELERWRGRFDLEVLVTVDSASPQWRGAVGVVTTLIPRAGFDPAQSVALVCGPEVMMRFAAAELLKRGVPADALFLSMERNMKCAVGFCGHCQLGPTFVCKDGPVYRYRDLAPLLRIREL
jgi:NAD(P)H-flavin reductase